MTMQNILLNFHSGSTSPLVCLLVVLLAAGLAYCLVRGYVYLMRKYGRQMAAILLSGALFSAVVADKPDAGSTNAPPDGVSGTNIVEQTGTEGTNDTGGVAGPLMMGRRTNQMENGEWTMDNAGELAGILHSPLSILHLDGGLLMTGAFGRPNLGQMLSTITDEDVENALRVVSRMDEGVFAEPTANAVTNAAWCDYGGVTDTFRLVPDGWRFPFGDRTAHGLTVLQNGDFRPDIRTRFFPRPFEADLALLPRWKWELLPDGGESVFWHEQTASNSLVLTWHNALYNRDMNSPTNFQAELFADGRFDYRYPDHTVRYAPVFPFDWDGDGLENSVDLEPLVAGPDAHGTNAEWYNRVCGNVFAATEGAGGVELAPHASDVNTNAYYFVDVVAESLAPIYFAADGGSDLGNPVVIANAGETNRVPLLVGLEYTVTSSVPFSVSCANASVVLNRMTGRTGFSVKWPVSFSFSSCGTDCYQVAVQPSCLNGVFSWTDGCCIASSGNVVAFTCSAGCSCGGCSTGGTYSYCGASLPFAGGGCCCIGSGGGPGHSETNSVMPELSLSMCLDHDVILFENAYTNRPNEIVGRRSTFVCVQLAYGNASSSGASLMLTVPKGADEVLLHEDGTNGNVVTSWHANLPPGTSGSKVFYAEGVKKSSSVHGVGLRAMISGSAGMGVVNRGMTSTEVWLETEAVYPQNRRRHVFGVGEVVNCKHSPLAVGASWQSSSPGLIRNSSAGTFFDCPLTNDVEVALSSSCGDLTIVHDIQILEPSALVATNVHAVSWDLAKGVAGGVGMEMDVFVLPDYVSFQELSLCEIPTTTGLHTGYFGKEVWRSVWYHTTNQLAGAWHNIQAENFFMTDAPCMGDVLPELDAEGKLVEEGHARGWEEGYLSWDVPIGWRERGGHEVGEPEIKRLGNVYDQVFHVTSEGTLTVRKFDYEISRTTNDCWSLIRRMKNALQE